MADRKITDLTALAAGSQATGDLVTIVDVSESAAADKNKKMTMENLFKGIPGDVGIGVSSPGRNLVVNSGASSGYIQLVNTNSGTAASNGFEIKLDSGGAIVDLINRENGAMRFFTNNTQRMQIDSSGNVGIGNTSPGTFTEVSADNLVVGSGSGGEGITIYSGTSSTGILAFADGTSGSAQYQGMVNYSHSANAMRFSTAGSERLRIDSSGRLLVGTTSDKSISSDTNALVQIFTPTAGKLLIGRSDASVVANDFLGIIDFHTFDGGSQRGARIAAKADGDHASDDVPSRIEFSTCADDSSTLTERMRIDSSGKVGIGNTSMNSYNGASNDLVVGNHTGAHGLTIASQSNSSGYIMFADGTTGQQQYEGQIQYNHDQNFMRALTAGNERMRIDSNGRLIVGASSGVQVAGSQSFIQHHGNKTTSNFALAGYANNLGGPILSFGASRSTTVGSPGTSVSSGDILGDIRFAGDDGTDINSVAASIRGEVDGTPGSNDMPGRLVFNTTADGSSSATERLRIDSSGNVTIKTNDVNLQGAGTLRVNSGSTSGSLNLDGGATNHGGEINLNGGSNGGTIQFRTGEGSGQQSEVARIDSSGRLLVGTSSSLNQYGSESYLQVAGTGFNASTIALRRDQNNANPSGVIFAKSRSSSVGGNTIVQNGDAVGSLYFAAADGNDLTSLAAQIKVEIDGTPGSNDTPGRIMFQTTADGSESPTERMRITSDGTILVHKTSSTIETQGHEFRTGNFASHTVSGGVGLRLNRLSNDGDLLQFYQATVQEGSISVSGTTVSYNGAHLSRWSQLPSGAERTEILRGSVLSNLDEMCEWGEEDNEQLNRMKVSDIEGDVNVSGVFQAWDDDDDTYDNDFYCAMTGDFVIRIAQGTTVARGDLLMSAGDGTAKPQDDDIVRSKTIAKVTSTTVSTTYADGSYCVPCVLMAC